MTLRELELQMLISQGSLVAALEGFRGDPVFGLDGDVREAVHGRLLDAETQLRLSIEDVRRAALKVGA